MLTTDIICSVKYDSLSKIAYGLECKHEKCSGDYKIVRSTGTSSDKMTSSNVLDTFHIMMLVAIAFSGTFIVFLVFYKVSKNYILAYKFCAFLFLFPFINIFIVIKKT